MPALAYASLLLQFLAASAKIFTDPSQLKSKYDYIIVGGGTAGSVVANRLSSNSLFSILVIEAGFDQTHDINAQVPLFCTTLAPNTALDWNYTTAPQPGLNGRSIPYARGRALGGSSVINYMVYNRGSQDDWNNYAAIVGNPAFTWSNMAYLMDLNEGFIPPSASQNNECNPAVHYSNGPLSVSLPILSVSLDAPVMNTANQSTEFPFQLDVNSGNPIGVSWMQYSIQNGTRSSANSAYIQPVIASRPNLDIITGAQATRVLQTGTSNRLPVFRRVEFAMSPTGPRYNATANYQVILASGSFNTPQLLMLSGIGDKNQLAALGIPTIVNLPSVGQNMSDHALLANAFQVQAQVQDTIQDWENSTILPGELAQWLRDQSGVLGDPGFRQAAWLRIPANDTIFASSRDPTAGPTSAHYELIFGHGLLPGQPAVAGQKYMNIVTNVISPTSRGSVTLASSDPFAHPVINPNLLGTTFDKYVMTYALKAARRYASSTAFQGYVVNPAAAYGGATSDADLAAYATANAGTVWHAVGTASMSPVGATWGVINPGFTVKGTVGLSIIDASGIPYVPSGHVQGAVYLWAESGALQLQHGQ